MMPHYHKFGVPPCVTQIYANLKQTYYWHQMVTDVSFTVRDCVCYARIGFICGIPPELASVVENKERKLEETFCLLLEILSDYFNNDGQLVFLQHWDPNKGATWEPRNNVLERAI